MATTHRDRVLLDPKRFDANTGTWDIPILTIRGVAAVELYIDGQLVPTGDYSIHDNHVTLNKRYSVHETTRAHLVIKYSPTNILVAFWLPIIVAALGLLGTLGQPLLHQLGVLYTPEMKVEPTDWGYDYQKHRFTLRLRINNLGTSDKGEWVVYVAVRKRDDAVDPRRATYEFLVGPFDLADTMEIHTPTTLAFTTEAARERAFVQEAIFLVKRGVHIQVPFEAAKFAGPQLRFIGSRSEQLPAGVTVPGVQ